MLFRIATAFYILASASWDLLTQIQLPTFASVWNFLEETVREIRDIPFYMFFALE